MTDANEARAKQILNEGIRLAKQGESRPAIQRFMLVINLHPESDVADNAHYNIGQIYMKEGDFSRAYASFKTIMELYPKSDAAIFAEDMMQECKHQADPASDLFETAQRAYIQGELDKARTLYEQLISESPDSDLADNAHFALGMLGKRLKDDALQQQHFGIVRTRYPDSDAAKLLTEVEAS